jgi:hypothetical protein
MNDQPRRGRPRKPLMADQSTAIDEAPEPARGAIPGSVRAFLEGVDDEGPE